MRLEWLDDIIAVMDAGSFVQAAERRFLSPSAFSRRIRMIEDYVGAELFDRTSKPVELRPVIRDQQQRIRELAAGLRDLKHQFQRNEREIRNRIVIASQHAITTSIASDLVRRLVEAREIGIRLRSANRDECYALLMTRQADVTLVYQSEGDPPPGGHAFLETRELGREGLIPVFSARNPEDLNAHYARGELPVIAYPGEVFLGQVMEQRIFPELGRTVFLHKRAETALTPAALQLALSGIGVAWLPVSLVRDSLVRGALVDLSATLPADELTLAAVRLDGPKTRVEEEVWEQLSEIRLGLPPAD